MKRIVFVAAAFAIGAQAQDVELEPATISFGVGITAMVSAGADRATVRIAPGCWIQEERECADDGISCWPDPVPCFKDSSGGAPAAALELLDAPEAVLRLAVRVAELEAEMTNPFRKTVAHALIQRIESFEDRLDEATREYRMFGAKDMFQLDQGIKRLIRELRELGIPVGLL